MNVNEWLRLIAGSLVLLSLILGIIHSQWWFLFTGFVSLNLIQSAFSKWCPMITLLKKAGVRE